MVKRVRLMLLVPAVLTAALTATGVTARSAEQGLVVHEWGTFTSVADADGQAVQWSPLSGPEDLPCFIDRERPVLAPSDRITNIQIKGRDIYGLLTTLPGRLGIDAAVASARQGGSLVPAVLLSARIRMETPVLYFYSPEATTVDVKVAFRQGAMSEWYPKAVVPRYDIGRPLSATTDTIEWTGVRVRPGPDPAYPRDDLKSHYYAARDVDAAPLRVGSQDEKFLFYRGVADFQPPLAAVVTPDGVVIRGAQPTQPMVLFENRGGRVGYRVLQGADDDAVERPELTSSVDALQRDLVAMLTAEGLYPREAAAMVETWRDSWFEEGTRLFYVVPQATVNDRLPLTIQPAPSKVRRVFVGRLELITDDMKNDVERAILKGDFDTLNLYGRFLDSIVLQIADRPALAANPGKVGDALRAMVPSAPRVASCGK